MITATGINPQVWTARQITAALNTDMRTSGWTWPDQITRPAAFLASRLKRIDWTPPPTTDDGGYAAGPDTEQAPPLAEATSTHHAHQHTQQEARNARLAAQAAARAEHAQARVVARAALGGPGHTAARAALTAASRRTTTDTGATAPPPLTYIPYRSVDYIT